MFSFHQERERERERVTEGQWKGASEFLMGGDEACHFEQCFKIVLLYIL